MEALDDRIIDALKVASEELGFRLVSPFDVVQTDGQKVRIEGYLPDFGGPNGMGVVSFARHIKSGVLTLPVSTLTKEYRKYRRKLFVSALNDWGWYGCGLRPEWLRAA